MVPYPDTRTMRKTEDKMTSDSFVVDRNLVMTRRGKHPETSVVLNREVKQRCYLPRKKRLSCINYHVRQSLRRKCNEPSVRVGDRIFLCDVPNSN